jgi:hypothetical protein
LKERLLQKQKQFTDSSFIDHHVKKTKQNKTKQNEKQQPHFTTTTTHNNQGNRTERDHSYKNPYTGHSREREIHLSMSAGKRREERAGDKRQQETTRDNKRRTTIGMGGRTCAGREQC